MRLLSLILLALLPLASHALNYEQRLRHVGGNDLIRHFDLTDRSGTAAFDRSPSATDGTYVNGVTLSNIVGGDGKRAPLFDGVNDHVTLGNLSPLTNSLNFTAGIMGKVLNVGIWTDGQARELMFLRSDGNNRIEINKLATNNKLILFVRAGGSNSNVELTLSTTEWFFIAVEFSGTTHEVFLDGVSQGTINSSAWTGSGAWDNGFLSVTESNNKFWSGYLANAYIVNAPLSPAAMVVLGKL